MRPFLLGLAFATAFAAGFLYRAYLVPTPVMTSASLRDVQQLISSEQGGVRLTNPLLDCADLPTAISEQGVGKLRDTVDAYIKSQVNAGNLIDAAYYYRDLNNGPWTIVGESNGYEVASMLKVPLAISVYKRAETTPGLLDHRIKYVPDPSVISVTQPYEPTENVIAGHSYTVSDLLRIMLQQSSNEATVMLVDVAGEQRILQVYNDLGLDPPTFGQDYSIGVRSYASFLRILYNATYLSRDESEAILSYMTKSAYRDGLVAGVPSSVTVAHKFGTRNLEDGTDDLSDCGIVYASDNPYVVCIMTHGNDFTALSGIIAHLSQLTYTYVVSGK